MSNVYDAVVQSCQDIRSETNLYSLKEKLHWQMSIVNNLLTNETNSNLIPGLSYLKTGIIKQIDNIEKKHNDNLLLYQKNDDKNNDESTENLWSETTPRVKGFSDIVGYENIKKTLITHFILPIYQPQLFNGNVNSVNRLLLFGPPGTGKTRIVHALASELNCKLYCITPSDFLSAYIGRTEKSIKAIFTKLKTFTSTAILFIDEVDGICRKRKEEEHESSRRLKTELMCQLNNFEENKFILMCATNCPWDLDSAFVRRFQKRIYVPLPNRNERMQLLDYYTRNTPLQDTKERWVPLLDKTEGFSASDFVNLIQEALSIPLTELIENTRWKLIGHNYVPADYEMDESITVCNMIDLPKNCVMMRAPQINDLNVAMSRIKRTVTEEEEEKYKTYI